MHRVCVRIVGLAAFFVVACVLSGASPVFASEVPVLAVDFPTSLVPSGAHLLTHAEADDVSGEGIGGLIITAVVRCATSQPCRTAVVKTAKTVYQVVSAASVVDWLCDGCLLPSRR